VPKTSIQEHKRSWWTKGTCGIPLLGSGISMVVDAGFYRYAHPDDWRWILYDTASLIILMTGLILMIDSIKHKVLIVLHSDHTEVDVKR